MEKNIVKLFDMQYEKNGGVWNNKNCIVEGKIETYSGPGSLLKNTDNLVKKLPIFLKNKNIRTIIDIPCGDFNFMKKIITPNTNINYLGIDISNKAINLCKKYETDNIKFKIDDITRSDIKLKNVDLIICKDLTLHLSFNDIHKVIQNVLNSKCKYFACSRYSNGNIKNEDMIGGESGFGCRAIEITKPPFNFNFEEIETIKYKSNNLDDELVFFKIY